MSEPVIQVEGLSKCYRLGGSPAGDLREALSGAAGRIWSTLRRRSRPGKGHDAFWALRDVSFRVNRGEVLGVIGRNGSGKSTLLKVLSQITPPTHGWAVIEGRVGSLLEVGTGFHPELTGRENIYLNGAILGMTRREVRSKFNQIVEFAEVDRFLDTPVKRYSSGMYVRLAFSVAAHLEPEVLIVDEVLAVGDKSFQDKCLGKMRDIATGDGRTVLFVSHSMDAILNLCDRVLVLTSGRCDGPMDPELAVQKYLGVQAGSIGEDITSLPRSQDVPRPPVFRRLRILSGDGQANVLRVGQSVRFEIELADCADLRNAECGLVISNERGQRVVAFQSLYHSGLTFQGKPFLSVNCDVEQLPLTPGRYYVDLACAEGHKIVERVERAGAFDVMFADVLGTGRLPGTHQGSLVLPCRWRAA